MFRLHRCAIAIVLIVSFILSSFSANASCIYLNPIKIKPMEVGNLISWTTTQEVDNQYFVIEKSKDGIDFTKVGDVKGAGFSNTAHTYRFLDFALGEVKLFYRLLHYSSDGEYTVTETFSLERVNTNNLMITSMNSAITARNLNLSIKSKVNATAFFEIKNYQGTVVKKGNKNLESGLNVLSFNLMDLKMGKYELVLNANGEKERILIRKVSTTEMPKLEYVVKKR